MIKVIHGDNCHEILTKNTKGKLSFDASRDFWTWRNELRAKLFELLKLDKIAENKCDLNIDFEETVEFDTYTRIRFTFESEVGNLVPCYLLIPKLNKKSYPLAICLQGHSTGFHNAVGMVKYERDIASHQQGTFGLQAIKNGFAALCIEQRGMGETRSPRYPGPGGVHSCSFTALTALNLGRTLRGERVWDVMRGIDAMEKLAYSEIDLTKIMILGSSGGGTASFYSACCDERIKYAAPACSFCSYSASIMDILHCVCNNIPEASLYFEMEDLAALIAPRRLTILTGLLDDIFPIDGVRESYKTVEKIFASAGVPENCKLCEMPKAHFWCIDEAWKAINEEREKLGW